jgi:hypothetical protein
MRREQLMQPHSVHEALLHALQGAAAAALHAAADVLNER